MSKTTVPLLVYFDCFSLLRLHRYKMPICLFNDNRSTNHKKKTKYHHMFIQWQSSDTSHEAMKWPDTAQRSLRGPQTVFSDAELNQNCVCCWEIVPLMHNSASSLTPEDKVVGLEDTGSCSPCRWWWGRARLLQLVPLVQQRTPPPDVTHSKQSSFSLLTHLTKITVDL